MYITVMKKILKGRYISYNVLFLFENFMSSFAQYTLLKELCAME